MSACRGWRSGCILGFFALMMVGMARPAHPAGTVTEEWIRRFNPVSHNVTQAMTVDGDGNVYVTGESGDTDSNYDYATVKYDSSGNEVWVARYNGTGNSYDRPTALAVDGIGNVYVTGQSVGGSSDYATVKYDADGNQLWVARYDSGEGLHEVAASLAVDSAGNVYVTGTSEIGVSHDDLATVKYDSHGNQVWVSRYDGPGDSYDRAVKVVVGSGGSVFVVGHSQTASYIGSSYATLKYAADGSQAWVAHYIGPEGFFAIPTAMAVDTAGNVLVTGADYSSSSRDDYATVKYSPSGSKAWVARYNGLANSYDTALALAVDSGGNIYVTGNSEAASGHKETDTLKYDPSGNQVWEARYSKPALVSEGVSAMALDHSANVYLTGLSYNFGTGFAEFTTVKYTSGGSLDWEVPRVNPTNGYQLPIAMALDEGGNVYLGCVAFSDTSFDVDYMTIKYRASDTTPPSATVGAVVVESPSRIYVPLTITDLGSKVASVKLTSNSSNCVLEWTGPSGVITAGINNPILINPALRTVQVRAVKVNVSQKARVEILAQDAAGNSALADPVIANLEIKQGRRITRVFHRIPQAERYVTLQNGAPGLSAATLTVNGKVVSRGSLSASQVVSLDVAQWLRPGKRNVVRISASGPKGSTAVLTIGDVQPEVSTPLSGSSSVNREFAP